MAAPGASPAASADDGVFWDIYTGTKAPSRVVINAGGISGSGSGKGAYIPLVSLRKSLTDHYCIFPGF